MTYKLKEYLDYQHDIRSQMMEDVWLFEDKLVKFTVEAGLSNRGADIDNVIKPLLDTFQGIFEEFNDNKVYHIDITKFIVKKGDEYINVVVEEYTDEVIKDESKEIHSGDNISE